MKQQVISRLDGLLSQAIIAARLAGEEIMLFYEKEIPVTIKGDGSPLTEADRASHNILNGHLSLTGIPVVSEEADHTVSFDTYWLIDPLDGTKDFINRNDEFTVNIALIQNGKAMAGILYAPALQELYAGIPGCFMWQEKNEVRKMSQVLPRSINVSMARSRFHDHSNADIFAEQNKISCLRPIGSALKFGRLAMGDVDVYPRFAGSSEWDIAAGQAILEAAGGQVISFKNLLPLTYSKPGRRNDEFIAFRSPYQLSDFIFS